MPETVFRIAKGSPLKWTYFYGGDEITVTPPRDNALWPQGEEECGKYHPRFCHLYLCTDSITIQIYHNNDDNPDILLALIDSGGGNALSQELFTVANGNYKNATIDLSGVDCPGCYQLIIYTILWQEANLIPCFGYVPGTFESLANTWECATGGNNIISRTASSPHSGTYCASIEASGAMPPGTPPSAGSEYILYCTDTLQLSANSNYKITAWIKDTAGGGKFTNDGDEIGFEIYSGFADAAIMYDLRRVPSEDGRDVWLKIEMMFHTYTDTDGVIRIKSSDLPLQGGTMFVDDVTLVEGYQTAEAWSEPICLNENAGCYKKVRYSSNAPSHNFFYAPGPEPDNYFYLPIIQDSISMEDPTFKTHRSSAGISTIVSSSQVKVINYKTDLLPPFMVEKLAIALKHQNVEIDGFVVRPTDPNLTPDHPERCASGYVEFSVIDEEYLEEFTYQA